MSIFTKTKALSRTISGYRIIPEFEEMRKNQIMFKILNALRTVGCIELSNGR